MMTLLRSDSADTRTISNSVAANYKEAEPRFASS